MEVEDGYLVQRAVECLLDDLDDDEAFQSLMPEERAASLAWVLAGLVSNGGFEAWIESLGQRTPDAVVGLRLLGADAFAARLQQVARLYPTAGAADADARLSAMEDWGDREAGRLHHLTGAAAGTRPGGAVRGAVRSGPPAPVPVAGRGPVAAATYPPVAGWRSRSRNTGSITVTNGTPGR